MVFETTRGFAGAQIPEPQVLVPGAGEGVVAIAGQDDVRDEVGVSVEPLAGYSVVAFASGQLPHDQGLVCNEIIQRG